MGCQLLEEEIMGRRSRVVAVGATFAAAVLTITGLAGGGGIH